MSPESVYLDAASSEPLHPAAREVLLAAYDRGFADPRRLHTPARDARLLLDNAREVVAESLGVHRDEVTFTSSGTDAVHRGLLGLAQGRMAVGRTIVHTAVEHQAVFHAAHWWGDPSVVAVDEVGRVDPERVRRRAGAAAVVAVQSANHEVGTCQPVEELALDSLGVPLFVDACASMGRMPLPEGWAAAAGSAHKWGGPAGVGIMLVRRGAPWDPPFPTDSRIDHRAVGFENVPGALAAAAALQQVVAEREATNARHHALIAEARARAASLDGVEVLGDPENRLPHLMTLVVDGVDGEPLVSALARAQVAVASGSACGVSTLEPSQVLSALGHDRAEGAEGREGASSSPEEGARSGSSLATLDAQTHGNLRLALSRSSTSADLDRFFALLPGVVADLRLGAVPQ